MKNVKDKNQKIGFILLPGGGMGSWIWDYLTPLLSYPSVCVDDRADFKKFSSIKKISIPDCVDHVVKTANASQFQKIILVGHSGSGGLLEMIAEKIPEKMSALIYISANIPPNGKRTVDVFPFFIKMMNLISVKLMLFGMKPSKKQHEKMIRKYLCNACSEDMIKFMCSHPMKTEPPAVVTEKIFRPNVPGIKKTFIKLSKDNTATLEFQDLMIANLGGAEEHIIDADHMVMLSKPEELAKILNNAALEVLRR